jgi:hypothetical protein
MPSETDKILEAYRDSQVIEEAPITPGSSVYDRAAVGAQKFITGHGGGISQMVGTAVGFVGGAKNKAGMDTKFASEDTANWLYNKLVPLLKRHDNTITVRQLKDFLKQTPLQKGGDKINPHDITVLQAYKDEMVLDEPSLVDLLKMVSAQLQEIKVTGKAARVNYDEIVQILSKNFTPAEIGMILAYYTVDAAADIFLPPAP